jgi:hypothetical protein
MSGLLRASVTTTNCFSADVYSLTFGTEGSAFNNIDFWSTVSSAYVEVTAVLFSSGGPIYQSLITGMVDSIHCDPIRGIVGVEGRDLSSSMIDSYRQQDFVNQTASEVVATIAQYHNLQPVVTATSGIVGRYYSDGYTKLSLGQFSRLQSDWDVVVQLARQNNFDVFVQGQSLYFQPAGEAIGAPVLVSMYDVRSMRVEKRLNLATNTTALVQSWNSQNMAAYQSNGVNQDATENQGAPSLPFLFSGSNYTSQQVSALTNQYAAELARLSIMLHIDMPWDLTLFPRTTILLSDTDSAFDATYEIDSIERHYSSTSGSTQAIRAVLTSALA